MIRTLRQSYRDWVSYGNDLLETWRGTFERPQAFTKFRVIDRLRRKTGAQVFVETGTFQGETAFRAAQRFKRVWTIELDKNLAQKAAQRLAIYPHVKVCLGDALDQLPIVMNDPACRDALIFLDGHFSGDGTALGTQPEPAADALEILARHIDRVCAIVVDDFRCFGTEPGFPSKGALLASAEKHFPSSVFSITVQWDQLSIVRRSKR